jgi:hypothetical protein
MAPHGIMWLSSKNLAMQMVTKFKEGKSINKGEATVRNYDMKQSYESKKSH